VISTKYLQKITNANIYEQKPKHSALTNIGEKYRVVSTNVNKYQYYTYQEIQTKTYKYHQTPPCQ